MNNFEVIPLFAVPLYRASLPALDESAKQFIKNVEYTRMPADNGCYSVNKYILDTPELASLKERIMSQVNHFIYDFLDCKDNLEFKIENSWVNRHRTGDFAQSHWHSQSLVSGVYYVEVGDDSGDIVFHKDRLYNNLFNPLIDVEFNYTDTYDQQKMNTYNVNNFGIRPINNNLILFPSHLSHSVDINNTNSLRYSIAFNLFPRGQSLGTINSITL